MLHVLKKTTARMGGLSDERPKKTRGRKHTKRKIQQQRDMKEKTLYIVVRTGGSQDYKENEILKL